MPAHIHPRRSSAFSALCVFLCLFICGCAAKDTTPEEPVKEQWDLSIGAQRAFHYLRYNDARRGNDRIVAGEAIEELLRYDPSPEIYLEAANHYWQQGNIGKARELLKDGIAMHPASSRLYVTLTSTYMAEKRFEDAALTLKEFIIINPDNYSVHEELAAVLLDDDKPAEALEVLSEIPKEELTPYHLFYLAKATSALGNNQKALRYLKRAVDEKDDMVEAWAEMAFLYELEKDFVSAEDVYSRILDMGETGKEIRLRLIGLNIKLNDPERALFIYEQGPNDLNYALEAATLFMDNKYYDQARAVLTPLAEQKDVPPKVYFYLSLYYFEAEEDIDQALYFLEQIPIDAEEYSRALRFRINLLLESDRVAEAKALIEEGTRSFPNETEYDILQARVLESQGDLQGSADSLRNALNKRTDDINILYALGIVLDKMEDKEGALEAMERIVELKPDHPDALNYIGYTLADMNRDLDRALVLINKALELKPDSGYIIDSLAWVMYRRGDYTRAWVEIQRAAELTDSDPVLWEHYGDIASALDLTDEARKGYLRSLELKPDNPSVEEKLKAL